MLAFKQVLVNLQKHQKVEPRVDLIHPKIDQALQRKSVKNLRVKRTLKISPINKRFVWFYINRLLLNCDISVINLIFQMVTYDMPHILPYKTTWFFSNNAGFKNWGF